MQLTLTDMGSQKALELIEKSKKKEKVIHTTAKILKIVHENRHIRLLKNYK